MNLQAVKAIYRFEMARTRRTIAQPSSSMTPEARSYSTRLPVCRSTISPARRQEFYGVTGKRLPNTAADHAYL